MKKEGFVLIILGLFLVVAMIGGVLAQCQYKQNVSSGIFMNVAYDNAGNRYVDPINFSDFRGSSSAPNSFYGSCDCWSYFNIRNKIGKSLNVRIQYQVSLGAESIFYNKTFNIYPTQVQQVGDNNCRWAISCNVIQNSISYQIISNDEITASIEEIKNQTCKQCGTKDCLNDGDTCTYDFQCGSNVCSQSGNTAGHCISERMGNDARISSLESNVSLLLSWQQTINNTLTTIQSSITTILNTLTGHTTQINNLNKSVTKLENQTPVTPNGTWAYCKYLSLTERKNIVCGSAIDSNMTHKEDCEVSCDITYKSHGKPSCKCKEIK